MIYWSNHWYWYWYWYCKQYLHVISPYQLPFVVLQHAPPYIRFDSNSSFDTSHITHLLLAWLDSFQFQDSGYQVQQLYVSLHKPQKLYQQFSLGLQPLTQLQISYTSSQKQSPGTLGPTSVLKFNHESRATSIHVNCPLIFFCTLVFAVTVHDALTAPLQTSHDLGWLSSHPGPSSFSNGDQLPSHPSHVELLQSLDWVRPPMRGRTGRSELSLFGTRTAAWHLHHH